MKNKLWVALSLIATTAAPGTQVFAQDVQLEEILVTARKRLENLQDIPVSVSAFTSETITARDIRTLEDLAGATTGLVFENYATSGLSAAPIIRGMSLPFTTAREQNTAVFLDGIYLQRQSMLNPGLVEMERIEVVKGPQSAVYGRNAFAGAINYVTKGPTDELEGFAGLTYGTDDRFDYSAAVGGPIIEDRLLGRVSYSASEFDGHTDNEHPYAGIDPSGDNTEDKLGGWDDEVFSAALQYNAGDTLSFEVSYFKNESKREPQAFHNLDGARQFDGTDPENTLNCLDSTTTTSSGVLPVEVSGYHAYCGEIPYEPVYRDDLAALGYENDIIVDPRSFAVHSETELFTARMEWDFSANWSMKYLFGYTDHSGGGTGTQADHKSLLGEGITTGVLGFDPETGIIFDYTDSTIFNSNPEEELEASSHEVQLAWDGGGDWQFRGGLYYSEIEDANWNRFFFSEPCNSQESCQAGVEDGDPALPDNFLPGSGHALRGSETYYEDDIYALFAEAVWNVSEQLTVGVEARYTYEDKTFEQINGVFGTEATADGGEDFNYFTPRFTVQYQLSDYRMLYSTLAKGVKTGGFNPVDPEVNPQQQVYDEEENWTLEAGSKNTVLDGALLLNVAAYYIQWSDQQGIEAAADPDGFAPDVIGNIGDVEIWGLELETVYNLNESWAIDAGLSYTDPEYDEAIYSPAVNDANSSFGCDDITCPSDGDVSGNVLARTSKEQAQLGITYRAEMSGWDLSARLDANYRSKMYATPLNLADNGSRTLANLSVSLRDEHWDLTLWGKNIFDEEYVANSFVLPSFSGYIVGLGPKATWGLNARYNF
ncbi:TonB-dependent receptor [Halioglobus maricola]|nr:TonB-dependent receptor [Halioglobus maricola]